MRFLERLLKESRNELWIAYLHINTGAIMAQSDISHVPLTQLSTSEAAIILSR